MSIKLLGAGSGSSKEQMRLVMLLVFKSHHLEAAPSVEKRPGTVRADLALWVGDTTAMMPLACRWRCRFSQEQWGGAGKRSRETQGELKRSRALRC